jgi:hypothetical protein
MTPLGSHRQRSEARYARDSPRPFGGNDLRREARPNLSASRKRRLVRRALPLTIALLGLLALSAAFLLSGPSREPASDRVAERTAPEAPPAAEPETLESEPEPDKGAELTSRSNEESPQETVGRIGSAYERAGRFLEDSAPPESTCDADLDRPDYVAALGFNNSDDCEALEVVREWNSQCREQSSCDLAVGAEEWSCSGDQESIDCLGAGGGSRTVEFSVTESSGDSPSTSDEAPTPASPTSGY